MRLIDLYYRAFKALRAESKKTGKVTNWDAQADELSRVRERISEKCKK